MSVLSKTVDQGAQTLNSRFLRKPPRFTLYLYRLSVDINETWGDLRSEIRVGNQEGDETEDEKRSTTLKQACKVLDKNLGPVHYEVTAGR